MPLQDKVTERRAETPKRVATTVVREDDIAWRVECEGGCGRHIDVAKREYLPQDYSLGLDSPLTQVDLTAPAARRCALCGPFPTE